MKKTMEAVEEELLSAMELFPPMASLHEAIAVIREEYLEVEQGIFTSKRNADQIRQELIQLAAMCVRAIEDCLQ